MSRFDSSLMRMHPAGRDVHQRLQNAEASLIDKGERLSRLTRFQAQVERQPDLVLVRLQGELDISQVHGLQALRPQTAGPTPVRVDMSGLTFLDLAALRHLLDAKGQSDRRGHTYVLTGASGGVRRLFVLMGVQHLLSDPDKMPCAC